MKDIAVVTGAASGIGRSLVFKYLHEGCSVAALDINAKSLEALASEAPAGGGTLKTYAVDVSREEQVNQAAAAIVADLGKPTVWINNAGIAVIGPFEEIPSDEFAKVLAVNFMGVVNGSRAALSVMKEPEHGSIANVASVNASVPAPFMTAYVSAKHAVAGFTRSLRQEKEQTHSPIRVILVSPGFVKTKIMEGHGDFSFPAKLQWLVEDPDRVAEEIIRGIRSGKAEVNPTIHGRLIQGLQRLSPSLVEKSTRLLTAKNWKELVGLLPIRK